MNFGRLLAISCVSFPMMACNSGASLDLEFSSETASARPTAELVIERLELQLREVKALPDDADESDAAYMAKGTFTLDLLDPDNTTVSFPEVPEAVYKKVEFKVDKPDDGGGIDGTDVSLWYDGTLDGVAFRYVDDKMDKITLRDEEGEDLSDGGAAVITVALGVESWLDGVSLVGLETDDEGRVVMEPKGMNDDSHSIVEDNVKAAIKLARKP